MTRKAKTPAICPKCGIDHKVERVFTGRGVLRCYCKICKKRVGVMENTLWHIRSAGKRMAGRS